MRERSRRRMAMVAAFVVLMMIAAFVIASFGNRP
jgi:predicted nucleic acid-binding Zn ribbon protein